CRPVSLPSPTLTTSEALDKITRALVGARRMLDVLAVERHVTDPDEPAPVPPTGSLLHDPVSGVEHEPGVLTCIVSSLPDEAAAIADRLGRFGGDDGVVLGDVRLAD